MLQDAVAMKAKGSVSRTFCVVSQEASFFPRLFKAAANPPSHLLRIKARSSCIANKWGISSRRDFSRQSKFRHLARLRFVNQPFRRFNSVPDVSQSFTVESCSATDTESRVFLCNICTYSSLWLLRSSSST